MRTARWLILIVLQAATVAWAYHSMSHLLASSPTRQMQRGEYQATSQPEPALMEQLNREQMYWGRQSLFSVACCVVVLTFLAINWLTDGRPPRGGENE